jgi:hypothetical protein
MHQASLDATLQCTQPRQLAAEPDSQSSSRHLLETEPMDQGCIHIAHDLGCLPAKPQPHNWMQWAGYHALAGAQLGGPCSGAMRACSGWAGYL